MTEPEFRVSRIEYMTLLCKLQLIKNKCICTKDQKLVLGTSQENDLNKLKKLIFSLRYRAVDSNMFHCSLEDPFKEDEESKGHVIEIMQSRVTSVICIIQ